MFVRQCRSGQDKPNVCEIHCWPPDAACCRPISAKLASHPQAPTPALQLQRASHSLTCLNRPSQREKKMHSGGGNDRDEIRRLRPHLRPPPAASPPATSAAGAVAASPRSSAAATGSGNSAEAPPAISLVGLGGAAARHGPGAAPSGRPDKLLMFIPIHNAQIW